jgi:hypothetical protein
MVAERVKQVVALSWRAEDAPVCAEREDVAAYFTAAVLPFDVVSLEDEDESPLVGLLRVELSTP